MDEADRDLPLLHTTAAINDMRLMAFTPCQTLAEIRTILAGDSHAQILTHAMLDPLDGDKESPGPAIAAALGLASLRRSAVGDSYHDLVVRMAQARTLVIMWRGNQHNLDFLLAPDILLDVLPRSLADEPVAEGATLMAESAVREHFKFSLSGLDRTLARAGTPPGCRRVVMGTPPPLHDEAVIRQRMCHEELFRTRAKILGIDLPRARITPAPIRRRLWRVLQDQMADIAASHGASFLPAPPEAFDGNGFLDPVYSIGDTTHCNVSYGLLALRQLEHHLQR